MMAHNLCYTTLLDKGTVERLQLVEDVDYIRTPNHGELLCRERVTLLIPHKICSSNQADERVCFRRFWKISYQLVNAQKQI